MTTCKIHPMPDSGEEPSISPTALLIDLYHIIFFLLLLAAALTVLVMSNVFAQGCSCSADSPNFKDVRATREQLLCSLLHNFTALRGFY